MKTTAKDFALFKTTCEEWLVKLSLRDWSAAYEHEDEDEALAACHANVDGKVATLRLCKDWHHVRVTPERIKRTAFHEVLHVLLADLKNLVNDRVCTDRMVTEAQHAIIRRLENLMLDGEW